jgi:hypothetical protein
VLLKETSQRRNNLEINQITSAHINSKGLAEKRTILQIKMETLDPNTKKFVQVHSTYSDAMDKLNGGDYHSALNLFEETKEYCAELIPFQSGENSAALNIMIQKCDDHREQIQQYIESSDEISLSESQYLSNSSVYRESELGGESMLFPSLQNREVLDESTINSYWGGYLWDKVEVLFGLLHPYAEQLQNYQHGIQPNLTKREEITLDSSFILLPKEESCQRISLNDPVIKMPDPYEKIKELESKNSLLQLQLSQTIKMKQPKGVTNLMNENTKLKKSIIDFSNHLQKHNNFRKAMTVSAHEQQSASDMELQNKELIMKIVTLENELLKKDKEIEAEKEKWLNIKREASARKKQRESSVSPSTNSELESTKYLG